MSVVSNNILAGASGQGGAGYAIERSLRFNSGDSANLSRTPSSAGNRKTWTWSGWVKRSKLGDDQAIFAAGPGNPTTTIRFSGEGSASPDGINIFHYAGSFSFQLTTTAQFRDLSSWYHVVVACDTTQATASDRLKLYVNGEQVTAFDTETYPSQNFDTQISSTVVQGISKTGAGTNYLNGYLADVHFIDGQALAPTDFGETDEFGVWQPKEFEGTHNATGTNYVSGTAGSPISSGSTYVNALDGSTSTAMAAAASSTYTVNFNTISNITTLRIFGKTVSDTGTFTVNGNSYLDSLPHHFGGSAGWVTIPETSLSQIVIGTQSNGYEDAFIYAIEVNGSVLVETPSGVNGFHLPFSDNSSNAALGTDTSGNSNTWTVNNLAVIGNGNWIRATSLTAGTFYSGRDIIPNIYNGLVATNGSPENQFLEFASFPATLTFNPAITSSSGNVKMHIASYYGPSSYNVTINGTTTLTLSNVPGNGTAPTLYDLGVTSLSSISFPVGGTTAMRVFGIVANGVLLADYSNPGNDSLVDSPTNGTQTDTGAGGEVVGNYATLNPLISPASTYLSDGNLKIAATTNSWVQSTSTIGVSSGKWYWEVLYEGTNTLIGVTSNPNSGSYIGEVTGSYGRDAGGGYYINGGNGSGFTSFASGTTLGVALDMDNGTVTLYFNGSAESTFATGLDTSKTFYAGVSVYGSTSKNTINFGQRAFAYAAPSGYKSLNTANLPDPTIADGSKYFDVDTYSGTGSSNERSNFSFSPDFLWVKARGGSASPGTQNHYLVDTVRGASGSVTKKLFSNTTGEENAGQTDSNNGIALQNDGFELTTGDDGTNNANNTYVAWAWDGGSSNTTIAAGSLNSSLYDQTQRWRSYLALNSGASGSSVQSAASNAFNSNISNWYEIYVGSGGQAIVDFNVTLTNVSTLEFYGGTSALGSNSITVTGTGINTTTITNMGVTKQSISVNSSTVSNLTFTVNGNNNFRIAGLYVNGKLLVDDDVTPTNVPSIASTVRANPSAGFSIVSYTGTGVAGTIGHSLNAQPSMVVIKDRSAANAWAVQHVGTTLGSGLLKLNTTDAVATSVAGPVWNSTAPTSSVLSVGTSTDTNGNGNDYIAYCFAPVEGYSAMGSYTGNGSTDGPFVFTGFRPAFIIGKRTDGGSDNWFMNDSSRLGYNDENLRLYPNLTNGEGASSDVNMDILSNGFKLISTNSNSNGSGATYIYYAVAEHPFKTARAR